MTIESEEECVEDCEEDGAEDCEVEEFTYEGIHYIIDPSNGTLYDKEAFEDDGSAVKVGTYDATTETATLD